MCGHFLGKDPIWDHLPLAATRSSHFVTSLTGLQGIPKVRPSNFMHYNFWSKLYCYMKFLQDVYFSIEYVCPEFQYWHALFVFFITFCSRCGLKWDTACRPTDDPFWAFSSPGACAGVSSTPKQYLFSLDSWKKLILGIHPKKIIIPAPFHRKAFVLLYKFETSWALLGRL